jgi:uncharacterized membrane protein
MPMPVPNKSLTELIGHALAFEVVALLICAPLFGWLMGTSMAAMGALTLAISLIAMGWNVVYNTAFDRLQQRLGFRKTIGVRVLHAVAFELGLIIVGVPLAAVWLNVGLWQAFVLDIGLLLFFLPYTVAFNAVYDWLRLRWVAAEGEPR